MKTITIEVNPIETAPKDGCIIMSWWDGRPVFISWINCETPVNTVEHHWYKLWFPENKTSYVDDGSHWAFVELRSDGKWYSTAPCGYFTPKHWARLPYERMAVGDE